MSGTGIPITSKERSAVARKKSISKVRKEEKGRTARNRLSVPARKEVYQQGKEGGKRKATELVYQQGKKFTSDEGKK